MADGDLKDHALNSQNDFYELLGVEPSAGDSEIRRAYRKTALKYHPDKVGADQAALDKFHLLQIAYDVLSDSNVRQLYDNARRAREEKKERDAAYEGRRRALKEELERRENAGVAGLKRKREEAKEEEAFQRELKRLAADGARRRKEREEQLRKEAQEEYAREQTERAETRPSTATASNGAQAAAGPSEIDRTIQLRYPVTSNISRDDLQNRFIRFGQIEDIVLRTKKLKPEGSKHRQEYIIAIIVFSSIVGAHAAVTDIPRLATTSTSEEDSSAQWKIYENVNWASGKEPDCIPKPQAKSAPTSQTPPITSASPNQRSSTEPPTAAPPTTPSVDRIKTSESEKGGGLRKVPSFGSFKGTPKSTPNNGTTAGIGSPSMEELTMIRLKNAERRRLAEKLRKEEEAAEADAGNAEEVQ